MPKGQTSRPNNRKEKKAAATLNNLKTATKGFSSANKNTVMSGKTAKAATRTLQGRDFKATDRKYGALVGKEGKVRTGTIAGVTILGYPKKKK